jgi:zinc finger protein
MSTNCDKCGYRDNEVKSGSAISDRGKRITLKVEDREDLSRDILKVIYIFPANAQNCLSPIQI